jgi:hypothetical protein
MVKGYVKGARNVKPFFRFESAGSAEFKPDHRWVASLAGHSGQILAQVDS